MNSAWATMKDEAGAAFTITPLCVLRPMGSSWPNGAVFPPPLAPVKWTYPSPKCRPSSALGVRPVRVERHSPWSIATLRQTIARVLLRQRAGCPFCGAPFYCGVENRRSGCSLPVAHGGAFAAPPQSGLAWLWFLFPLIEPDRHISRIRLSEKVHEVAHGRLRVRKVSRTRPSLSCREASGNCLIAAPCL